MTLHMRTTLAAAVAALATAHFAPAAEQLQPLKYNNPGLVVDLGVGLWANPLPMDYDGDGHLDLVVVSPDKPYNGIYLFKNPGSGEKLPVFPPAVKIDDKGLQNLQVSHVDGQPRVLRAGEEMLEFRRYGVDKRVKLGVPIEQVHQTTGRIRANQWRYVDYDGDSLVDLVVGIGDWSAYGWDDAFNERGEWTNGPLHGLVYVLRNTGTNEKPKYAAAEQVHAGGKPINGFGMPSPSFADFDGDGDLDLICGEFLDGLTYYENVGSRTDPRYAAARALRNTDGQPIKMDLQMIQVVSIDWTGDGRPDLIVGEEDGRVALVENTGKVLGGAPVFEKPAFFQQEADNVKFGALVTPVAFDWDGDGDSDILAGNTAGYIGFIENLGGGDQPKWARPRYLEAGGEVIRIMAGYNGSIQGPAEAKWGYTTIAVADWDHDGLADIIANSIWGRVIWYRNIGTRTEPRLAAAQALAVQWDGEPIKPSWNWWDPSGSELVTQWRTTPMVLDITGDGLNDLVMLDRDGYLALFERRRDGEELVLLPPKRIFSVEAGAPSVFDHNHKPMELDGNGDGKNDLTRLDEQGRLAFYQNNPMVRGEFIAKHADRGGDEVRENMLRLTGGWAGRSGRRKLHLADWDGDGKLDLLVNSTNITFLRNVATQPGEFVFKDMDLVDERVLAGHDTSPATVDWTGNGRLDLLVGAEDGFIYYMRNPRSEATAQNAAADRRE